MEKITYTKAHREIIKALNIDAWRVARIDIKCPSEDTLSKINEVFISRKTFKVLCWDEDNFIRLGVKRSKKYKVKSHYATYFDCVVKIEEGKVLGTAFRDGAYERDFWIDREDITNIWLLDKDANNLASKLENVEVRDHMLGDWVESGFAKISFERQNYC